MTARPAAEIDYTPLVAAAFGAAAWLLVVKVLAVLVAASTAQATVEVALALGVFPYLRIAASAAAFTAVVTVSVAAMGAGAAAIMVRPAVAGRWRRQVVRGRAVGVILAFETLLFELARHRFVAPVLRPDWVWGAALVLLAAVVAAAWAVRRADPDAPPASA